MDEYISREELRKHLKECYDNELFDADMRKATIGIDVYVENMPAADVQPMKHGEWDFRGYQLFKCTNCKEIFTQNQLEAMQNHIDQEEFTFPNFCPNCGARMDGDVE